MYERKVARESLLSPKESKQVGLEPSIENSYVAGRWKSFGLEAFLWGRAFCLWKVPNVRYERTFSFSWTVAFAFVWFLFGHIHTCAPPIPPTDGFWMFLVFGCFEFPKYFPTCLRRAVGLKHVAVKSAGKSQIHHEALFRSDVATAFGHFSGPFSPRLSAEHLLLGRPMRRTSTTTLSSVSLAPCQGEKPLDHTRKVTRKPGWRLGFF